MAALLRRWFAMAALATGISVGLGSFGCAAPDLRGKGFEDGTANWSENLRPPADESKFFGVDERAREVERNLGVR